MKRDRYGSGPTATPFLAAFLVGLLGASPAIADGEIERVDVATDGTPIQYGPIGGVVSRLSGDGRYAVFVASYPADHVNASSLGAVYRRDLRDGVTELLNEVGGRGFYADISDDGNLVVYQADGSVLLRNVSTGEIVDVGRLPAVRALGVSGAVLAPAISGDGGTVAFTADVPAPPGVTLLGRPHDVIVVDVATGMAEVVSDTPSGERVAGALGATARPGLSRDGRHVAFYSLSDGLFTPTTLGQTVVLVRDRETRTTTVASVDENGSVVPVFGGEMQIGADGSIVGFVEAQAGSVLRRYDRATGTSEIAARGECAFPEGGLGSGYATMDAAGRRLSKGGDEVFDRVTGEVFRVDATRELGRPDTGVTAIEDLSADGRYVLFSAGPDLLSPAGPDEYAGLYRRDLGAPAPDAGEPRTTEFDLPTNEWVLMSLPCEAPDGATLMELFADDVPGDFGDAWVAYTYDTDASPAGYVLASDAPAPGRGEGFWIQQSTDETVRLDLPPTDSTARNDDGPGCLSPFRCRRLELESTPGRATSFDMVGSPFVDRTGVRFDEIGVRTETGECDQGCALAGGDVADTLVTDFFYGYDAASGYAAVGSGDVLAPWRGYWTLTTHESGSGRAPLLLMPAPPR